MHTISEPHRCPKCDAPVVDRRSAVCTNCHAALPDEWIMTADQIAKVATIDQSAKAEHSALMTDLDPANDPTTAESIPIIEPTSDRL